MTSNQAESIQEKSDKPYISQKKPPNPKQKKHTGTLTQTASLLVLEDRNTPCRLDRH